ncbi:MAG: hypothetical protein Tsb002_25380 [Wenzhouxiangellaceae bacterium]
MTNTKKDKSDFVSIFDVARIDEAKKRFALDGSGICVAIIDTGIDKNIDGIDESRIRHRVNICPPSAKTEGAESHGTKMAIQIGLNSRNFGIAPFCSFVSIKAIDHEENLTTESLETALKWIQDNSATFGINIVSISASLDGKYTSDNAKPSFSSICNLITSLKTMHIPVICSTGNKYHTTMPVFRQGLSFPAITADSISVGSIMNLYEKKSTFDDLIKAFNCMPLQILPISQRLSTDLAGRYATNILAPGYRMRQVDPNDSSSYNFDGIGTSYSVAVMSGIIALLQQFYFRLHNKLPSVDYIKQLIQNTGRTVFDGDDEEVQHKYENAKDYRYSYSFYKAVDAFEAAYQIYCESNNHLPCKAEHG